jgi:acetyltransferase-like isoleucine patch superfamily enzyme
VAGDLPAGVLAVGNPARVVRSLAESARDDSA